MALCPICQSSQTRFWAFAKDYEYFSSEKIYSYFNCKNCYSLFIDPIPELELKKIYPANYYSFVNKKKHPVVLLKEWLDKQYLKKILKTLDTPDVKVLDVGGGTGWLSQLVKEIDSRVKETQIIDIDEKAKNLAEEQGHRYFHGRLEDFTTSEKYDLILMLNLIEHVSDPLAILQKASSLLSDNGVILIKTPNTQSLDAKIFHKSYWGGLHCPRHWIIFSEKSFRLLTGQTKLKIKSLHYTQGGPFWAFSIIVALYRKKMVHVSSKRPVIFHPLFPIISALAAIFDFIWSLFSKTSQMFILLNHLDKKKV